MLVNFLVGTKSVNGLWFALAATLTATVGTGFTATVQAAIVSEPLSVVCPVDATYCTDTSNHLDWYKFSNVETTVGLSYHQAIGSSFALAGGWRAATGREVNSLWAQYGWTADTPTGEGHNDNSGLASAVISDLGPTLTSPGDPTFNYILGNIDVGDSSYAGYAQLYSNGRTLDDRVDTHTSPYIYLPKSTRIYFLGTWLVRETAVSDVSEPGTLAIFGVALAGLGYIRRRQLRSSALDGLGFVGR